MTTPEQFHAVRLQLPVPPLYTLAHSLICYILVKTEEGCIFYIEIYFCVSLCLISSYGMGTAMLMNHHVPYAIVFHN